MINLPNKLEGVLKYVLENQFSSLYRDLYSTSDASSISSWSELPFLTKEHLLKIPIKDRVFLPYEEVRMIQSTSGTSGTPFVTPRANIQPFSSFFKEINNVQAVLAFTPPQHRIIESLRKSKLRSPLIAIDPMHLDRSVAIAAKLSVTHLMCPYHLIELLKPSIEKYGLREKFIAIMPFGAKISRSIYNDLQDYFPNATVSINYSAIEFQGIVGKQEANWDNPSEFIPAKNCYLEIIDDEDKNLTKTDSVGEIVITTLDPSNIATPLLRYRTGDLARIIKYSENNEEYLFEVLGRKITEKVELLNGELQVYELEKVLEGVDPKLSDHFQLHVYENLESRSKKDLVLHVVNDKEYSPNITKEKLSSYIGENLRIASGKVYGEGNYGNIEIKWVPNFPPSPVKFKKIILH